MVILAAITIYGLVTGQYLFMVFLIPISFDFFNKFHSTFDEANKSRTHNLPIRENLAKR